MPSPVRFLPGRRALSLRAAGLGALGLLLLAAASAPAAAQSLRGSRASMDRQNLQARAHDFTFLATPGQVHRFVDRGYLVKVPGDRNYRLHPGVSFPYARPEVKLFLERLGSQYRAACGEPLIVTSLTRPRNRQPRNASPRSVHPTGMALDLRVSRTYRCRRWIEQVFLSLERTGVLEANREHRPPHYHVALFPKPYVRYVERIEGQPVTVAATTRYTVRRGDTLWRIARSHGTTVSRLKAVNAIRSSRIRPGQVLAIPAR